MAIMAVAIGGSAITLDEGSPTPDAPRGAPADDTAWYRMGDDAGGFTIEVGTISGGPTAVERVPLQPFPVSLAYPIAGLTGGTLYLVSDDADVGRLSSVDAATGASRVILSTPDQVVAGQVTTDGLTAYVLIADRARGRLSAVLATDTESGATRVLEDLEPRRIESVTAFLMSLDGSALVIGGCAGDRCELRRIDIEDGTSAHLDYTSATPELIGVTGRLAVTGVRNLRFIDLVTGEGVSEPTQTAEYLATTVVVGADGHDLVVGQISGSPDWGGLPRPATDVPTLEVIDLTLGRTSEPLRPDLYAMYLQPASDVFVDVDLPAGWVLASGITHQHDETISYFALNLADGRAVAVPPLGSYERP
jgi:hypothetical protein